MNFSQALELMKQGKRVTRDAYKLHWSPLQNYYELKYSPHYTLEEIQKHNIQPSLTSLFSGKLLAEDLLAEDWQEWESSDTRAAKELIKIIDSV